MYFLDEGTEVSVDSKLKADMSKFAHLTYEDFQRLARDPSLSPAERIGFPDSYRAGFESVILSDLLAKMAPLNEPKQVVLDLGCGSTSLPVLLRDHCASRGSELVLVDSAEQLALVPSEGVTKLAGRFPAMPELVERYRGKVNAIIVYSVLQYVFDGSDMFAFLDAAADLLAPGGHLLLGDIPNVSKRKRFFASETGVAFHQAFMKTSDRPQVDHFTLEPSRIDDSVALSILMRYRMAGFDTYVLPQPKALPMSNRREDLLIVRP